MISRYDSFHGDEMYCRYCDDKQQCDCNDEIEQKAEQECDAYRESSAFEFYLSAI